MRHSLILRKIHKTAIFVFQGRLRSSMLVFRKACQQCLLWWASSLCQSATVFMPDYSILAEVTPRI